MRWMVIYEYGVPGGALNLNSTNYPDHGHHGNFPLQGKIPMVELGIVIFKFLDRKLEDKIFCTELQQALKFFLNNYLRRRW
jgi:hypothetical protein